MIPAIKSSKICRNDTHNNPLITVLVPLSIDQSQVPFVIACVCDRQTVRYSMDSKLPSDVVEPRDIARIPPGITDDSRRRIWTPVAKDWVTFEKYGRETGGEYTLLTVSVAPGGANAPHWHGSYSETFTAEKGHVGIYAESRGRITLSPGAGGEGGESITVIPGEVHHFFNPGDDEDVVMKVKLQPAREGFEKGLYILYGLAREAAAAANKGGGGGGTSSNGSLTQLMHMAVVCSMSDMWPPPRGLRGAVLIPVLKMLAFFGRIGGVEERLVRRYWA